MFILFGYGIIKYLLLVISVQTSRRTRQGVDTLFTHALECAPLQRSSGFDLSKEDPSIYANEDLVGYNPERQWPDIPLPQPTATDAPQLSPVTIPEDVIQKARGQHDVLVKWLKTAGVDLCREMEDVENQYTLEAVMPGQKECTICKKKCHNTQRLRAHIMAQHMSKTPFFCAECNQYFGDNNTLKLHNRKHDPDATRFICTVCQKVFLSLGRLNEHKKKHNPAFSNLSCRFKCGKKCDEKKNMVAHEKYCSANPDKPPKSQCPYCSRSFQRLKDLKKHAKNDHASRFPTLLHDMGLE